MIGRERGVGAGGGKLGVHVCQFALDQLIVRDRLRKLRADVGVWENEIEGGLHYPGSKKKASDERWMNVFGRESKKKNITYPNGPALRTSLSMSRPSIRTLTPQFNSPRRFWRGTKTLSNTNSPVLEPRIPSLSSFRAQENPLELLSTMKAEIPLEAFPGSVLAYTMI